MEVWMMKGRMKPPFTLGWKSPLIIMSILVISILTMLVSINVYRVHLENEAYIVHTQAYYVAEGEAMTKRALIEEYLSAIYENQELAYDNIHIKRAVSNIKDIETEDVDNTSVLIRYDEPINQRESLYVELIVPIREKEEKEI